VNEAFRAMKEFLGSAQSKVQQEGFKRTLKDLQSTEEGPTNAEILTAFDMLQQTNQARHDQAGMKRIQQLWAM